MIINPLFAINRFIEYCSEMRFAFWVCATWNSRIRLVIETSLFHLQNAFRKKRGPSEPFTLSIRLSRISATISMRRSTGDIFVFYEVLKQGIYHLGSANKTNAESIKEIIDCGGNIGISALYFADRYPNARIISIEPLLENYSLLKHNVQSIRRIVPVFGCVSDSDGERFMTTHHAAWGNTVTDVPTNCCVPSFTMARLINQYDVEAIDVLKVDIEGEEAKVFAAPTFLPRTKTIVIELHGAYGLDCFQRDIAPYGFVVNVPGTNPEVKSITAARSGE
jgi:FkbM family methyltransferase